MMEVVSKQDQVFTVRELIAADAKQLSDYFLNLSAASKKRYGPHPLTTKYAHYLCQSKQLQNNSIIRLVIINEQLIIVGYIILDANVVKEDALRYESQSINLYKGSHYFLAPSIADNYQNQGIASRIMPVVTKLAKSRGAQSLVLMGGTQLSNKVAVSYYQKTGFIALKEFQTDVTNIDMYLPL